MTDYIAAWTQGGALERVEKMAVHRRGLKHPAVSVFVIDGAGRTLLQKRAAGKYHSGGKWANACCSHPHWGEAPNVAAGRRLKEELGLSLPLRHAGVVEYRAEVGDGMIEDEVVEMFIAHADARRMSFALNPDEVSETSWVDIAALPQAVADAPWNYAPWLRIYVARHAELIFGPRPVAKG
jgi:isopentenyl-diphosphate delta-isomerase